MDEDIFLRDIEKLIKHSIPREVIPGFEPPPGEKAEPIVLGRMTIGVGGTRRGGGGGGAGRGSMGAGNRGGGPSGRGPGHAGSGGRPSPRPDDRSPRAGMARPPRGRG
jgi:ATP-dependent RNA helicase RhlE